MNKNHTHNSFCGSTTTTTPRKIITDNEHDDITHHDPDFDIMKKKKTMKDEDNHNHNNTNNNNKDGECGGGGTTTTGTSTTNLVNNSTLSIDNQNDENYSIQNKRVLSSGMDDDDNSNNNNNIKNINNTEPKHPVVMKQKPPPLGPVPTLLNHKEMDALYEIFHAVTTIIRNSYNPTTILPLHPNPNHNYNSSTYYDNNNNNNNNNESSNDCETTSLRNKKNNNIDYIITGGTLLGAVRQHSILFCDDDIDIAIVETFDTMFMQPPPQPASHDDTVVPSQRGCVVDVVQKKTNYEIVRDNLIQYLDPTKFQYQIQLSNHPSTGSTSTTTSTSTSSSTSVPIFCDRIRHCRMNQVFLDLFVIRPYRNRYELQQIIQVKQNGLNQTNTYISNLINEIESAIFIKTTTTTTTATKNTTTMNENDKDPILLNDELLLSCYPLYHFHHRKAIELWPKEVYQYHELYPIQHTYYLGPYQSVCGPKTPIHLLYRAFGIDCFHMYYISTMRHNNNNNNQNQKNHSSTTKKKKKNQTSDNNTKNDTISTCTENHRIQLVENDNTTTRSRNDDDPNSTSCTLPETLIPTTTIIETNTTTKKIVPLPPRLLYHGTTYADGTKVPLEDIHYIPIQPTQKHLRRCYVLHNKEELMKYITKQTIVEQTILQQKDIKKKNSNHHRLNDSTSSIPASIDQYGDKKMEHNHDETTRKESRTESQQCFDSDTNGECSILSLLQQQQLQQPQQIQSQPYQESSKNEYIPTKMTPPTEDNTIVNHQCELGTRTSTVGPQHLPNQKTVYMDGVFDMFHRGHLEAIKQCTKYGNKIIIGVTGDMDAKQYKRQPIINENDRATIIKSIKDVDDVICPCPLIITEEFMKQHQIDIIVHGFANDADYEKQMDFFDLPIRTGRFQRISYYTGLSTTNLIQSIQTEQPLVGIDDHNKNPHNSNVPNNLHDNKHKTKDDEKVLESKQNEKWFSTAVRVATNGSSLIPYDPIPLSLRNVIEVHMNKARIQREKALHIIRLTTGPNVYDSIMVPFQQNTTRFEGCFQYDTKKYDLRKSLLKSSGQNNESFDLSRIHEQYSFVETTVEPLSNQLYTKDRMCYNLTQMYCTSTDFQNLYDQFVREVCVPYLATLFVSNKKQWKDDGNDNIDCCNVMYYQSYPCIRIIQPNEFSIGPHADVTYGHHPCSINFYIPLTTIGGSASLFLESRMGSEDWHPIEGNYGLVKHFAGAICAHWTTDNRTDYTRVSLDFRLIHGNDYDSIITGEKTNDVYRLKEGYYSKCQKKMVVQLPDHHSNDTVEVGGGGRGECKGTEYYWDRVGPLHRPDARMGFPWTVKNWQKVFDKKDIKS